MTLIKQLLILCFTLLFSNISYSNSCDHLFGRFEDIDPDDFGAVIGDARLAAQVETKYGPGFVKKDGKPDPSIDVSEEKKPQ